MLLGIFLGSCVSLAGLYFIAFITKGDNKISDTTTGNENLLGGCVLTSWFLLIGSGFILLLKAIRIV